MTDAPEPASPAGDQRDGLELAIARDIRALTAASDQLGHLFARLNNLRPNDFRALTHIATADSEGSPLTAGQLRTLMGVSPAAVTYLVERMIESGHIERDVDQVDRRKARLRYSDRGMTVAGSFFIPVGHRTRAAMAELPDADLQAAHRVLLAVTGALRDFYAEGPLAAP
ncbi:MarR family winged helix-turn-helix transcriptional regulator [Nocardia sp. NPDC051463]|uniref:MarR family winged helix-turn-helix transcriptional regulator n=1 Tax=Nocardia sp. NPDC051463 TaxID=3154845 RepID=UPI00344BC62E